MNFKNGEKKNFQLKVYLQKRTRLHLKNMITLLMLELPKSKHK